MLKLNPGRVEATPRTCDGCPIARTHTHTHTHTHTCTHNRHARTRLHVENAVRSVVLGRGSEHGCVHMCVRECACAQKDQAMRHQAMHDTRQPTVHRGGIVHTTVSCRNAWCRKRSSVVAKYYTTCTYKVWLV